MVWQIIHCDEFAAEFLKYPEELQDELLAYQVMLSELGPGLGRPTVDTLKGSKLSNLKDLRFEWQREPYRFLFAFDSKRRAIILVGGSKAGDKNFYVRMIRMAERRYEKFIHKEEENERDPRCNNGFCLAGTPSEDRSSGLPTYCTRTAAEFAEDARSFAKGSGRTLGCHPASHF